MKFIKSKWYDVRYFLPGNDECRPVRCINIDEHIDFYFMAYFDCGEWEFFDEKYNKEMQVTHWQEPLKLEIEHEFKGK